MFQCLKKQKKQPAVVYVSEYLMKVYGKFILVFENLKQRNFELLLISKRNKNHCVVPNTFCDEDNKASVELSNSKDVLLHYNKVDVFDVKYV